MIDGETLLRTLLAWKRGEPRVCEMVAPPTPDQEDRRRLSREREILLRERVQHGNRIKGLLMGQGISDYDPLHKDCRNRLAETITGDGRSLPARLRGALLRELERIELLLQQIADVEAERDASVEVEVDGRPSPIALLLRLKALVRKLPRFYTTRAFIEALPIGVTWPPMPASRRRHGGVARSTESKVSRKPATRVYVTS
jgi:transposase